MKPASKPILWPEIAAGLLLGGALLLSDPLLLRTPEEVDPEPPATELPRRDVRNAVAAFGAGDFETAAAEIRRATENSNAGS